MDNRKIGEFIAERRRAKNMTQQELADKLSVTVQAVSKWECGKGMPDSSLMVKLAEVLGISVTELLCGEKVAPNEEIAKAEQNSVALLHEMQSRQISYGKMSNEEKKELQREYNETTSAKVWAKLNLVSIFQSVVWIALFCLSTFLNWGQVATTVMLVMMVLNATVPLMILLVRTMLFSMWLNLAKNIKEQSLRSSSFYGGKL